jgi:hypothetical protein
MPVTTDRPTERTKHSLDARSSHLALIVVATRERRTRDITRFHTHRSTVILRFIHTHSVHTCVQAHAYVYHSPLVVL